MLSEQSLRYPLTLLTILILSTSLIHAQGWELVGPDSANWRHVTGRFSPSGSYELAAATYGGILTYTSNGSWNYITLRNIPGGMVIHVEEELPPGTDERTFDGSNLASGIYIARLSAGSFSLSRKIILMK